ncbi:MAG: nucleotide exchange factor GrpE [Candidatus Woesearchaeota archaeon]
MEEQTQEQESHKKHKKLVKQHHEKELEAKDSTIKELTEFLQRLQAEFENYKKRIDREEKENREHLLERFFTKLLPILDSFELCLKNTDCHEELVKGIELIYSQFYCILEDEGLKPIDAEKKDFNPHFHEALIAQESEEKENTVLEELQKGYMLKNKVIRHSKVKVAKKGTPVAD